MQGEPRVERRLAAIFAGDVAGYSRLMGTHEIGTLRALQAHRKGLIDPLMAAYHGRIVKTTGDGILAEFASAVDAAMQIQLAAVDIARTTRTRPENLDAEDLAERCQAALYNSRAEARRAAAFGLCERALQIDSRNVIALVNMSRKYISPVINSQSTDPPADIRRADELVTRALAIDPNSYTAHVVKAYVLMAQKRTEEAIVEAERALALNPSFMEAYLALSDFNNFLGRPDRALELADKEIRLSPRDPYLWAFFHDKGWAFFMKGEYDQAIEWLRRSAAIAPQNFTL